MGSGTYERQGNYLSTGSSGGYTFLRFPNGESFDESTGRWSLYFETGFYVNAGNFYGANFRSYGTSEENYNVYGPGVYHLKSGWAYGEWNQTYNFWEWNGYTSYSQGELLSELYLTWKPTLPTYTITYNANGGTGAPAAQTKTYGKHGGNDLTLSTAIPTRENYRFVGWATSSTATSADYQAGGTYSANASTVLYAVWELAFLPPTSLLTAYRVRAGSTDRYAEGTEVYATVEWQANPIDSTDDVKVTSITATLTEDGQAVTAPTVINPTLPALSGTSTIRFAADTSKRYALTVTVTDSNGLSTVKTANVSNVKYPIYVSHNNGVDTVKIEALELGNPLGWAHGGTGGQVAVLFDDPTHELYGTYTLSESIVGYDMLEVVAVDNDGNFLPSVKVLNPAVGTRFTVLGAWIDTNNFWFKGTTYEFETATTINTAYGTGWMRAQIDPLGNTWEAKDMTKIVRIIGYKA